MDKKQIIDNNSDQVIAYNLNGTTCRRTNCKFFF